MSRPWSNRSLSVVAQADATFEWYVDWLKRQYPAWSKEQREEQAEKFAMSQVPPPPPEPDPEEIINEGGTSRQEHRRDDRKKLGELLQQITKEGTR